MTGRLQIERFIRSHRDPGSLPDGRFVYSGTRKVKCVLCGRDGYGVTAYDPTLTYPARDRAIHRMLLAFIGEDLVQVEGPDTAPPAPRQVLWPHQFGRWQIACMEDHPWPCSCGLSFPTYANLWRHIGADRPAGWGRQGEHYFALECEVAS